jgi:hypothetical protein
MNPKNIVLTCFKCKQKYTDKAEFEIHIKSCNKNVDEFQCPFCTARNTRKRDLVSRHVAKFHAEKLMELIENPKLIKKIVKNASPVEKAVLTMEKNSQPPQEMPPSAAQSITPIEQSIESELENNIILDESPLKKSTPKAANIHLYGLDEEEDSYSPKLKAACPVYRPTVAHPSSDRRCQHGTPLPVCLQINRKIRRPDGTKETIKDFHINCAQCVTSAKIMCFKK